MFPMTSKLRTLMNAPSEIDDSQLKELEIKRNKIKEKKINLIL